MHFPTESVATGRKSADGSPQWQRCGAPVAKLRPWTFSCDQARQYGTPNGVLPLQPLCAPSVELILRLSADHPAERSGPPLWTRCIRRGPRDIFATNMRRKNKESSYRFGICLKRRSGTSCRVRRWRQFSRSCFDNSAEIRQSDFQFTALTLAGDNIDIQQRCF